MKFSSYERFFGALSNKTRSSILESLYGSDLTVSELVAETGFEQSRISHNLKVLKTLGFVECESAGRTRVYSLNKTYFKPVLESIDRFFEGYKDKIDMCEILDGKKSCRYCDID